MVEFLLICDSHEGERASAGHTEPSRTEDYCHSLQGDQQYERVTIKFPRCLIDAWEEAEIQSSTLMDSV